MTSHYSAPMPHPKAKLRWVVWSISVLFVFYKYILEVSPSIMTKELMTDLHIDAALLGHVAASYYYAYTLMQIPVGLLIDKFGPRKVTTIGVLICSFGAYLFSISDSVIVSSGSRFLMGIGATFAVLNTLKISSNWFPASRFALLTGLMLTLGTLGAVFGQAPLSIFMQTYDWRPAIATLAFIGFIFALIFFFCVRDKPPHIAYDVTPETKKKVPLHLALLHTIQKPQTWILSIFSGLAFAPVLAFGGLWGVSFLQTKYSFSHDIAAFLTSLIFIGFALGAPLFGWFSTRIGVRKPVMVWGTVIAFFLLILVLYVPVRSEFLMGVILFLFGFSISAFLLSFTVIHEINIPLMTASAIGIMNTLNGLFGALTDPLVGFFLDLGLGRSAHHGNTFTALDYEISLSFLPAYLIICLILLIFVKETYCKQRIEE